MIFKRILYMCRDSHSSLTRIKFGPLSQLGCSSNALLQQNVNVRSISMNLKLMYCKLPKENPQSSTASGYFNAKPILSNHTCSRYAHHQPGRKIVEGKKLVTSRLMHVDDCNPYGIVHGGKILKMVEVAGCLRAMEYCNEAYIAQGEDTPMCLCVPARFESMQFIKPLHAGDIADVLASVIFCSKGSLLVKVDVFTQQLFGKPMVDKGHRLAGTALIWYVPVNQNKVSQKLPVPPMMEIASVEQMERGKEIYQQQRLARNHTYTSTEKVETQKELIEHTMAASRCVLAHVVDPTDVAPILQPPGICQGGALLKLMDEAAGLAIIRHTQLQVATVSMDATNFLTAASLGCLLTVTGTVTHTTEKTIEAEVVVNVTYPFKPRLYSQPVKAAEAYFTYVAFDKKKNVTPVPQLKITSAIEQKIFDEGEQRYELRKQHKFN